MKEIEKIDIKSMTIPELEGLMKEWGEPKFRAGQIFQWLHQKRVLTFEAMQNLPLPLRQKLLERCRITAFTVERKLISALDGTIKYLYRLPDGEYVESVFMRYEHGTVSVSQPRSAARWGAASAPPPRRALSGI